MGKISMTKTKNQLLLENEELRSRLTEAEEALNAIRNGEVDAIVVSGPEGEKVFTLTSAETPYRIIVEEMNEGSVALSEDGTILYCNRRFAELVSTPLEQIMGSNFIRFVGESDKAGFHELLKTGLIEKCTGTVTSLIHENDSRSFHLSFSPLPSNMLGKICIMIADFTHLKKIETELRLSKETLEERVNERTIELRNTIEELAVSQTSIRNMMESALEDKNALEISNKKLIEEITERKQAEERITLFSKILMILNRNNDWEKLIGDILTQIKSFTGFDAVGIRLKEGEDYPYFVQYGFTADFLKTEGSLCDYDKSGNLVLDTFGNPYLACMCGNIIFGRTDSSKSFFTGKGSFWSNNTTKLLISSTDEALLAHTRNRCIQEGYESEAIIPLQSGDTIIGLLQLNDKRPDRFTLDMINYFEELASTIGVAYSKFKSEERIQESEEKYRNLVENALIGVYRISIEGDLIFGNDAMLKIMEIDGDDYSKSNAINFYKNPDNRKFLLQTIQEQGEIRNFETELISFKGNHLDVIINARLEGKVLSGVMMDITERKKALTELIIAKQHAEESDRLKSTFLANMSHEIRTPMNGILGFAELLNDPHLSGEDQKAFINVINKSGHRMLNIINDIVEISKIESGQMETSLNEININEQTEYIHSLLKPEAENKGLQFFVRNTLPIKEAILKTDREKLYSILTNLVKNAIKFTQTGSVEFGYEKKGDCLEFFVKDTGVGIPQDQQEIIFTRFRQGNDLITRPYEGTGLGLSISKAYVEMLGGKLWVKSQIGKGSQFYFTIHYTVGEVMNVIKDVPTEIEADNKVNDLIILIAEDDEDSAAFITTVLEKFSKEVLKANTGVETVKLFSNNPSIDLILMDIRMPEMDGYEATRQIRRLNKDVIIIAQTAYGLSGDRKKAIDAGCNEYLSKPIDKDELLRLMQKHFKR
jgi:PAS domain S-box-containing protein